VHALVDPTLICGSQNEEFCTAFTEKKGGLNENEMLIKKSDIE